jgi:hypothetical protein
MGTGAGISTTDSAIASGLFTAFRNHPAIPGFNRRGRPADILPMSYEAESKAEMLRLWLVLQRAVGDYAKEKNIDFREVIPWGPWESQDRRISEAWGSVIQSQNLSMLEEWRASVALNGFPLSWTDEAIRQCRGEADWDSEETDFKW